MLDRFLEINSLFVALGSGGVISLFVRVFKQLKAQREQTERRFRNLESANLALLHDKIYQQCIYFLEQGWISVDDLENLEYIWKGYRALGGNGTGEALYSKILTLPHHPLKEEEKDG